METNQGEGGETERGEAGEEEMELPRGDGGVPMGGRRRGRGREVRGLGRGSEVEGRGREG